MSLSLSSDITSNCFKATWYNRSIIELCIPVHINLGPTPENAPSIPSCLYIDTNAFKVAFLFNNLIIGFVMVCLVEIELLNYEVFVAV